MVAWMNAESYAETLRTGRAVYYSRSRRRLWRKGEESGHEQVVRAIYVDCDADTILLKVEQSGAACHEGYRSCFFREATPSGLKIVAERLVDRTPMLSTIGEMPFPHRHIPADGANNGGPDPRDRKAIQVKEDYPKPFRIDAEPEEPLKVKSRNFH